MNNKIINEYRSKCIISGCGEIVYGKTQEEADNKLSKHYYEIHRYRWVR